MKKTNAWHKRRILLFAVVGAIFVAVLACNLPEGQDQSAINNTATFTEIAAQPQNPTEDSSPAEPTTSDTPTPEPEATVEPTATLDIEHTTQPGEPAKIRTWVSDLSSEPFAAEHRAIGDNLNINLLERPFTADGMDYQPYLDIIKVEIGEGDEWIYVVLHLEGEPPTDVDSYYAIEIDLDRDGRGDWLISARIPATEDWTTDGVSVWRDSNHDVGGFTPMIGEAPLSAIDGYDERVFNAGQGDDPDAAWVRRAPSFPQRVQLAFKHSLIDSASTFLWGGWSEAAINQPGWYDYNDHFTLEQAGSPAIGNDHYPLAELYSLDNTCRWTYGFEPTRDYPGLCPLPTPTPTATSAPAIVPDVPPQVCTEPPNGCPRVRAGLTNVYYVQTIWNPNTCQCELP